MKRLLKLFLVFWAGIFILSFFTAKADMLFWQRIGYTAILALTAPVFSLFGNKKSVKKSNDCCRNLQNIEIHLPLDPKVLCCIKNHKIYKSMDAAPIYEVKGNKIYPYLSSKPAFRIENNKVFRGMDAAPFLEIKGDKIYHNLSSKVVYEILK